MISLLNKSFRIAMLTSRKKIDMLYMIWYTCIRYDIHIIYVCYNIYVYIKSSFPGVIFGYCLPNLKPHLAHKLSKKKETN